MTGTTTPSTAVDCMVKPHTSKSTFANMQKGIESIHGEEASSVFYEAELSARTRTANVLLEERKERGEAFIEKWISVYEETDIGGFKIKKVEIDYNQKPSSR